MGGLHKNQNYGQKTEADQYIEMSNEQKEIISQYQKWE